MGRTEVKNPANWFYVLGSLCFLAGTIWNMVHS